MAKHHLEHRWIEKTAFGTAERVVEQLTEQLGFRDRLRSLFLDPLRLTGAPSAFQNKLSGELQNRFLQSIRARKMGERLAERGAERLVERGAERLVERGAERLIERGAERLVERGVEQAAERGAECLVCSGWSRAYTFD